MDIRSLVLYEYLQTYLNKIVGCLGPHGIWNLHKTYKTTWILIYPHVVWGQHEKTWKPCHVKPRILQLYL